MKFQFSFEIFLRNSDKNKTLKSEGIFLRAEMAIRDYSRSFKAKRIAQKYSLSRLKIGIQIF